MADNIFASDCSVAARNLGLDPNIISWGDGTTERPEEAPLRRFDLEPLDDSEWDVIVTCGVLPPDPPQFDTMSMRVVLQAVIAVVAGGRPWTNLDDAGLSSEAVRKKFARLAAKGTWQELAAHVDDLGLSEMRKSQIRRIGVRAQQMARR